MAVAVAVYCVFQFSGAYINPAVTIAFASMGQFRLGPYVRLHHRAVPRRLRRRGPRVAGLPAALGRDRRRGTQARRVLHRAGHLQRPGERHHRDHRYLRAGLRRLWHHRECGGGRRRCRGGHRNWHQPATRRPARPRYRALARWSDRLRHQPGARPGAAYRPRRAAQAGKAATMGGTPGSPSWAPSSAASSAP